MTVELETVTGRLVNIENPDPSTICIEDIAWGLSRQPRFCGHTITAVAYNVAQHSIFVADEVERILKDDYPELLNRNPLILAALLHDAAEVYTGDWPSPVKRIPALHTIIKQIEQKLDAAIFTAFGMKPNTKDEIDIIKRADRIAQKIEAHAFMTSRGKHWPDMPEVSLPRLQEFSAPLPSLEAYTLFLDKFNSLRQK